MYKETDFLLNDKEISNLTKSDLERINVWKKVSKTISFLKQIYPVNKCIDYFLKRYPDYVCRDCIWIFFLHFDEDEVLKEISKRNLDYYF